MPRKLNQMQKPPIDTRLQNALRQASTDNRTYIAENKQLKAEVVRLQEENEALRRIIGIEPQSPMLVRAGGLQIDRSKVRGWVQDALKKPEVATQAA